MTRAAAPDSASPDDPAAADWVEGAEQALLDAALRRLADHGRWDDALIALAAAEAGLSKAEADLVVPHGPRDLAALLSRRHDAAALTALEAVDPATLKIRARIRLAVLARVDAAMGDELALRRSGAYLALPGHAALGARLLWAAADGLWRWAGDTATDFNHYSKRAILSTVIASTLAVRLAQGRSAAEAHLDRAIDGVMAFETFKRNVKFDPEGLAKGAAGLLAACRFRGGAADAAAGQTGG